MALTPPQEARAQAWARVFEDGPATLAVLDDMKQYANQFTEPLERAGATSMILYIMLRSSQLRREKRRNGKRG